MNTLRLAAFIAGALIIAAACAGCGLGREREDAVRMREKVSALEARGLYAAAIQEMERHRLAAGLDRKQEADLLYKMGKMADKNLSDCERALPYYTMATALHPEASWSKEAEKRSVVCLERTGRSGRAKALLDQATGGPSGRGLEGPVVAVVDGHSITWPEVLESVRMRYKGDDEVEDMELRKHLVRQYVFTYILTSEARRSGLDQDPVVAASVEQAVREVLASAYLRRKYQGPIPEDAMQELGEQLGKNHEVRIFEENVPQP